MDGEGPRIVAFPPRAKHIIAQSLRDRMQELTEQIENGDVEAIAFTIVRPDGSTAWGFSASEKVSAMLGGIAWLQRKVMDSVDE